ncbi:MAG TPA: TIGR03067 domain-containing protein [Gemmataceae bacterium]|nr:TIGR03067 domain-containing protein [Gemmataceae bacterium]
MRVAVTTAVFVLFAGAALADDAAAKRMLKDLEGSYTPVSMTRAGDAAPDEFRKSLAFVIKGDTFTVRFDKDGKGKDHAATIVLDPGQKPTAIDMTPKDGPDAGKPMLGIIKVEKDTVTLCWSDETDKPQRPKEFSSTKENKNYLVVMKKGN